MSLQAVLFDMDGVIVDTEPLHHKAYFLMFDTFGIDVSAEMYAGFAGASTKKVCQTLKDQFILHASVEEMIEEKRKNFKILFDEDPEFDLIPGVLNLIQHYYENNISLVLASSASHQTIEWVFEKFNLEPYFLAKISGADLPESKPHPEIFLQAARLSGKPKENCMVIEDSTNGVIAANRAGIFCAGFQSPHTEKQDISTANIIIDDFAKITLEKINSFFP